MTNARSPGRAFDPYNHSLASEMRTVHILAIAALIGWSIEKVFWWPVRHHWRSEARAATWYQRYMPPASGLTERGKALRRRASIASGAVMLGFVLVFALLPLLRR